MGEGKGFDVNGELTTTSSATKVIGSLDEASEKLASLQETVEELIGKTVTPNNAVEYLEDYANVEKDIGSFLGSLIPLIDENKERKSAHNELEKVRKIWENNKNKCSIRVNEQEKALKEFYASVTDKNNLDSLEKHKEDTIKYTINEWANLERIAKTHVNRIDMEMESLNKDVQVINKISYQVSSFNLRLQTLVIFTPTLTAVENSGLNQNKLKPIQDALNASLKTIQNLEKGQLALMKSA